MKAPNFFCIGAQKSGTTLLHELLKEINGVYLPVKKEIHFFDNDATFKKGLDWYLSTYFSKSCDSVAIGEITPAYLFIDQVSKRIRDTLGDKVRFIVILRNPIQRAYSQYIMKYKSGEETYSFNDALILESSRMSLGIQSNKQYAYLARGLYAKQLQRYLEYFDKEQFLFLEFEEFVSNQDAAIEDICSFLGITKDVKIKNRIIHTSKLSILEKIKFNLLNGNYDLFDIFRTKSYPDMSLNVKKVLLEYYKNDIKNLENIIDKDLSKWLQ